MASAVHLRSAAGVVTRTNRQQSAAAATDAGTCREREQGMHDQAVAVLLEHAAAIAVPRRTGVDGRARRPAADERHGTDGAADHFDRIVAAANLAEVRPARRVERPRVERGENRTV